MDPCRRPGSRKPSFRALFIAGTTKTPIGPVRIIGVCIPWDRAHISTGRKDRRPWEDHHAYLKRPAGVLAQQHQAIPAHLSIATEGLITEVGSSSRSSRSGPPGQVPPAPFARTTMGSACGDFRGTSRSSSVGCYGGSSPVAWSSRWLAIRRSNPCHAPRALSKTTRGCSVRGAIPRVLAQDMAGPAPF